jgi:hypothetical protein
LEQGIIEQSNSEWAAPIVIVKKKDGTIRLCVDYRPFNVATRVNAYPMPRIDDLIDRVGQTRFISTLDLTKGYWQILVMERDQPKTAFTTPFGLYQFKRMPFGLMGAPATFQRVMDQVLNGLQDFTSAYLDDLIVFSTTWEHHVQHVDLVLNKLEEAGLTAKPVKCQFGMRRCSYLGHVVGAGEVRMEQGKVEAVREMKPPKTKKDVATDIPRSYRLLQAVHSNLRFHRRTAVRLGAKATAKCSSVDTRCTSSLQAAEIYPMCVTGSTDP